MCCIIKNWYAPHIADREIRKEGGKSEAERLQRVKECLAKRRRIREAARRAGVHPSTIEIWISNYKTAYICRLKNQLRQVLPQQRRLPQPVRPLLRRTASGGPGKAGIDVLTGASSFEKLAAAVLEQARKGDSSAVPVDTSH
ncbi:MAG: transposase [Oscillospiraceae bacterium]|nr:transposase [Oscillospiraceae bacterium]